MLTSNDFQLCNSFILHNCIVGARSNNTSILAKLQELNMASEAFSKKSDELENVMKELEDCRKVAEK
jgi:hypothetical protein